MIETFIFDVGGTLVKNDEALIEAIGLALKENNIILRDKTAVMNGFGKSN